MKVWERDGWTRTDGPTPAAIRQMVNNGEIGGEMHDSVLMRKVQRAFDHEPIEAAAAIEAAHVAGYLKPGFWGEANWAPGYPDRGGGS